MPVESFLCSSTCELLHCNKYDRISGLTILRILPWAWTGIDPFAILSLYSLKKKIHFVVHTRKNCSNIKVRATCRRDNCVAIMCVDDFTEYPLNSNKLTDTRPTSLSESRHLDSQADLHPITTVRSFVYFGIYRIYIYIKGYLNRVRF